MLAINSVLKVVMCCEAQIQVECSRL